MDISGPVRALLQHHVKFDPDALRSPDPLYVFAHFTLWPHEPDPAAAAPTPQSLPPFLAPDAPPLFPPPQPGNPPAPSANAPPASAYLAAASTIRIMPRISRALRDHWSDALLHHFAHLPDRAQQLLLARTTTSVDFLWHHWLLLLARERLLLSVPDSLFKALWRRGISAPPLAPAPTSPSRSEIAAHQITVQQIAPQQAAALHAAYNALAFQQNFDLLPAIEKMRAALPATPPAPVEPPAESSPESPAPPWALAAFAGLDDSPARPAALLASTTAHLASAKSDPLTLALLADALLTQEDAASGATY